MFSPATSSQRLTILCFQSALLDLNFHIQLPLLWAILQSPQIQHAPTQLIICLISQCVPSVCVHILCIHLFSKLFIDCMLCIRHCSRHWEHNIKRPPLYRFPAQRTIWMRKNRKMLPSFPTSCSPIQGLCQPGFW